MKNPVTDLLAQVKKATKLGEYVLARKLLLELIRLKPEYAHAHTLLGNVYELSGEREKAAESYEQSIKIKPDNAEAYNNLGVVLKNQKRYKEALYNLKKAISISGERADIRYNIGNVYKEMEKPDKAIEEYDSAIRLDPAFALPYNNLGIVLESKGRIDDAAEAYARGLAVDPNNPRLRTNHGVVLEKKGDLAAAAAEFAKALRARPGRIEVMEKLASVLGRLGEHREAISLYNDILRLDGGNLRATNNLGIEYVKAGNVEKASACYEKALAADPGYATAHFNLGSILLEEGYYAEALAEIRKVLSLNPDDAKARFELGNALLSLGQFREAEAAFLELLSADPGDPDALRALGNLSLKLEKYERADEYFRKSRQAGKESAGFKIEFARVLANKDEFDKVKTEISGFLKHHPQNAQAESLLGEICIRQGDTEGARKAFESAIEKKPMIVEPYYHLARLYRDRGESRKAIDVLDRLIAIHGTRAASFDLLSLNEALALYEEVASGYERENKLFEKRKFTITGLRFDENGRELGRTGGDSLLAVYPEKQADAAIIRTGVNEPAMHVKEEERVLRLVESTDTAAGNPVVNIEDTEPPPFQDLLRNQIVYDEIGKIRDWALRNQRRRFIDVFGTEGYGKVKNEREAGISGGGGFTPGDFPQHRQFAGSGGTDEFTDTQRGIIEKVLDGMGSIMKTLYDRKNEIERPERETGTRGDERKLRKKKKKKRKRPPAADKASELLLEQEKREKETLALDPVPAAKSLRESLREYIRRIRHKLDSGTPLEVPEDEAEIERIKKLVDEAYEKPVFDERMSREVPPASESSPVYDEPESELHEEINPEADSQSLPVSTETVSETIRESEREQEPVVEIKIEEEEVPIPEIEDGRIEPQAEEYVVSAPEEDEDSEPDILDEQVELKLLAAGDETQDHADRGTDEDLDNYELIIEDETAGDGIPEDSYEDDKSVADPAAGKHGHKPAGAFLKTGEPVGVRVVEGFLTIISRLLVIIPMPGIRTKLRDGISGLIGRLKR